MKKIVFAILLALILCIPVNAQEYYNRYNTVKIDTSLENTIENGVIKANFYKTGVTTGANVTITLRPTGNTDNILGLILYADQDFLYGEEGSTLARSDSSTAQIGGVCKGSTYCIINWPYNTIDLKAVSSTAAIEGQIMFYIDDLNK